MVWFARDGWRSKFRAPEDGRAGDPFVNVQSVDLALEIDRQLGEAVSSVVRAHHRRRLARIGWARALDPAPADWAAGDPPSRQGNALDILIDGAAALPQIARELERAESHVHLTGWYVSPDFALTRSGEEQVILRNILAELAERVEVRVLVWAGAPLPLFRPSRRMVRAARESLIRGTKIRCLLDARERPLHCHHEKTVVVDDKVAFVGGIDLTSESGDRFDTSAHPARGQVGWHDATARLAGPAVADVAEHFGMRWHEVSGELLPAPTVPKAAGELELQIVRTVPEKIYRRLPDGDFRILESYLRALASAQRLIYLENQFLWSPEITAVLRDKLRRPPADEFRLLVVLPAKPNSGGDDTRGVLGDLIEADAGAGRFLACTLYARSGRLSDRVYVHAKIGIVDDAWLTLGSANLNEHSLLNDTEMNVVTRDPGLVRQTRLRLWAEHLELPLDQVDVEPRRLIEDYWKPISSEQLTRQQAGEPLTHRLVRLPGVSKRSKRLLGPLQGLLVDG
jgi:phosphatidylserine/phosphatidylglycerophosphate/cardiolipin synthase-like enzyme